MPTWLTLIIALPVVAAIYLTTPAGQRLALRLGLDRFVKDGPSSEDRDYLLRVCDGDRAAVERRLDAERARNPALGEKQVHRNAIRRHMNEQRGGMNGADPTRH